MEKQVASFKTWLLENHVGMDTRVGDLARDVKRDEGFPGTDEFTEIYDYIQCRPGSSRDAVIALMEAYVGWHDYIQEFLKT